MSSNFEPYYDKWLTSLRQLIIDLDDTLNTRSSTASDEQQHLRQLLINKTMSHYADYHLVKSSAATHDVLDFFAAPWTTALERSLQWIGGWRPTTAFHLVYTESSILFETHVVDILRGCRTGDLGDLTPGQFRRVSELQCDTVNQENDITGQLADWQDTACDLVSVCGNIDGKMKRLTEILERADRLRLRTMESMVELLTPKQAAEFLVAAAELHFGIRGWGTEQDRKRGIVPTSKNSRVDDDTVNSFSTTGQ